MIKNKWQDILRYVVLVIAAALSLFPIYWMIASATNTSTDVIRGKLTFGLNLLQNYQDLIQAQNLKFAMFNSARNAALLTVL